MSPTLLTKYFIQKNIIDKDKEVDFLIFLLDSKADKLLEKAEEWNMDGNNGWTV